MSGQPAGADGRGRVRSQMPSAKSVIADAEHYLATLNQRKRADKSRCLERIDKQLLAMQGGAGPAKATLERLRAEVAGTWPQ